MTEPLLVKWKLFIPWLKSKPAEHQYEYGDCDNCIICQFVKETHGETIRAGGYEIGRVGSGVSEPIPREIINAVGSSFTPFGLHATVGIVLSRLTEPKGEA